MEGTSKKITVGLLVVLILMLLGVVVFIAITLQQSQAPTDSGAASVCILESRCRSSTFGDTSAFCGFSYTATPSRGTCAEGYVTCTCTANDTAAPTACSTDTFCQVLNTYKTGYRCKYVAVSGGQCVLNCATYDTSCLPSTTNNCPNGVTMSGACGTEGCAANQRPRWTCNPFSTYDNKQFEGCSNDATCNVTQVPDTNSPDTGSTSCTVTYNGTSSFTLSGDCSSVTLRRYKESYDGINDQCPTTENQSSMPSGSGQYAPDPAPGECVQIDYSGALLNGVSHSGGVCGCRAPDPAPVITSLTCYKCTPGLTDANMCEPLTVNSTTCPAGTSATSACESAVGGACPVVGSTTTTCYRCTTPTNDGNMCESFTVTGTSCPSGSSITSACENSVGGTCPVAPTVLPQTAIISDSSDRFILGFLLIIIGALVYKFDLIAKLNTYFYVAKNLEIPDFEQEVKAQKHLKKVKKLKKDRKSFEDKVSKKFEK